MCFVLRKVDLLGNDLVPFSGSEHLELQRLLREERYGTVEEDIPQLKPKVKQ